MSKKTKGKKKRFGFKCQKVDDAHSFLYEE